MRKIVLLFIAVVALVVSALPIVCAEDGYDASAQSWVLYCPDNGKIIASENADKRMKPASTTKLLTTLITLEKAQKDNKTVTFTKDMIAEGSSMYLELGEKVKLSDLAVGMMMTSGNDAANAAALSIAGSFESFAEEMNKKAAEIGMKNTHFVTPSGLDDENHYSTAYDMALLMSEALKNDDFAALTAQKRCAVKFVEPKDKQITYGNHNKLLSLYQYCIGGKTGYTMAAGRCLVSAAKKDGLTLVCVTMNDRKDWDDHIALYEKGFENLSLYSSCESDFIVKEPCVGSETDSVTVVGENDFSLVLSPEEKKKVKRVIYLDSFLYAPVGANEVVGRIEYLLDGKPLGSVSLIASESAEASKRKTGIFEFIKELFTYG